MTIIRVISKSSASARALRCARKNAQSGEVTEDDELESEQPAQQRLYRRPVGRPKRTASGNPFPEPRKPTMPYLGLTAGGRSQRRSQAARALAEVALPNCDDIDWTNTHLSGLLDDMLRITVKRPAPRTLGLSFLTGVFESLKGELDNASFNKVAHAFTKDMTYKEATSVTGQSSATIAKYRQELSTFVDGEAEVSNSDVCIIKSLALRLMLTIVTIVGGI